MTKTSVLACTLTLLACLLGACTDGSDSSADPQISESQQLFAQFGNAGGEFDLDSMQALLDFEDQTSPVALLQMTSVQDSARFAEYESAAADLWQRNGGSVQFMSASFAQMLGERPMDEVRLIRFSNIAALLNAIRSPEFTSVVEQLYMASQDLIWVLGVEQDLPADTLGSFVDPNLQGLDQSQARALLGIPDGVEPPSPAGHIVNMLASDSPSPFWMVNLIDFRDQAQYEDGRDTTLSGREANAIYGDMILPQLAAYNSQPMFLMDVAVNLSDEALVWESLVIVRYASRDAFLNIFALNPSASSALVHKDAGIENTLVYATEVPTEVIAAPESGPLYNFRYCEVLLLNLDSGSLVADVYNSVGRSDCPQEQWDALDAVAIAQEFGAINALLNGVRFWVLDAIQNTAPASGEPPIANFGGIEMFLGASVEIAAGSDNEPGPYQVNRVSRSTVFHYVAGRQVYELIDPEGRQYMMQSFTQGIDRNQQLVDLQFLGGRLSLPAGWRFNARILTENFQLPSVNDIAEVITDDLGNTYQRVP